MMSVIMRIRVLSAGIIMLCSSAGLIVLYCQRIFEIYGIERSSREKDCREGQ